MFNGHDYSFSGDIFEYSIFRRTHFDSMSSNSQIDSIRQLSILEVNRSSTEFTEIGSSENLSDKIKQINTIQGLNIYYYIFNIIIITSLLII